MQQTILMFMSAYDRNCYLGMNIRKLRAHDKLSQSELADIVGVTPTQLGRIECGKTVDPSTFVTEALSTFFGYYVQDFLWRKLEPQETLARAKFHLLYELPAERQQAIVEAISGMTNARRLAGGFDRKRRQRSQNSAE